LIKRSTFQKITRNYAIAGFLCYTLLMKNSYIVLVGAFALLVGCGRPDHLDQAEKELTEAVSGFSALEPGKNREAARVFNRSVDDAEDALRHVKAEQRKRAHEAEKAAAKAEATERKSAATKERTKAKKEESEGGKPLFRNPFKKEPQPEPKWYESLVGRD